MVPEGVVTNDLLERGTVEVLPELFAGGKPRGPVIGVGIYVGLWKPGISAQEESTEVHAAFRDNNSRCDGP
jgi:hypothetical protein